MLDTGTPITTVDWMMRHYVSDTTAGNLRRLRDGCKWVNRCISKLQDQDWGFKSWETFLLFPRSLEQYGRFAWTKNTYEAFTKDMGAPEQAQPIVDNGFIPYCIPCFIKIVAGLWIFATVSDIAS
ncbi:uncharacterized protein N7473_011089 [Penicillium subrubescens]|uniref:uncharacterized protein n=1 Tax=Penicillium subrubescens TaxID=1316194 RepID=UPI00254595CF|nr:uncharacterized protein N7473_011089 [Penicillium subrubescens]KAJ5882827.1 hypothetical protein N7473_011089 [Penicillium subrubescens]